MKRLAWIFGGMAVGAVLPRAVYRLLKPDLADLVLAGFIIGCFTLAIILSFHKKTE